MKRETFTTLEPYHSRNTYESGYIKQHIDKILDSARYTAMEELLGELLYNAYLYRDSNWPEGRIIIKFLKRFEHQVTSLGYKHDVCPDKLPKRCRLEYR